ncbi:hypothetical protein B0H14DRAFT_2566301 [Mycena olivaceomarginata]|nr:hypothetical protein B0H14DRAFT_2566301 [Mycena olivaceomarginata]
MSDNESVDLAPLTDDEQGSITSRNSTTPSQHLSNHYNFVYWAISSGSKRLTVSNLDSRAPVPVDITVALSGIYHLIANNTDAALEWQFFPFPPSESIPTCTPGFSPPRATTTADGPTRDQLNNALHLRKSTPGGYSPSETHYCQEKEVKAPAGQVGLCHLF